MNLSQGVSVISDTSPKTTVSQLRALRAEFEANAKKTLAYLDRAIWDAEVAEMKRENQVLLASFVPAGSLEGHDIVFLIGKSKSLGTGHDSFLGRAVDTAFVIHSALKDAAGVTVSAKFWGQAATSGIWLGSYNTIISAYETNSSDDKKLLPLAKEILADNTPDKVSGRHTHYILISDGALSDELAPAASVLAAAAQFNPKITFDAVICGAENGVIACALPGNRVPVLTTAATAAAVKDAVIKALKTVLAATAVEAPAAKADEAPKP